MISKIARKDRRRKEQGIEEGQEGNTTTTDKEGSV